MCVACADLQSATGVVISGGSAGGLATYLHVDEWREVFPHTVKVVGMPDSGFFLDYQPPASILEDAPHDYHNSMVRASSTAICILCSFWHDITMTVCM
jgi:hypothetical protein